MAEIALGFVVSAMLALRYGAAGTAVMAAGAGGAVVLYLASCLRWPYRRCPLCGGRSTRRRGLNGSYRRRRPCLLCGGRDYVRVGARLLGRE